MTEHSTGHLHPLSHMIREINKIFYEMGFEFATGPELETEHYNFDALNVPADHPSRDMQDTFWVKQVGKHSERLLLRTHTSPVQIRYMEDNKPPFRIIVPGKVYRNEATDATHEAQFYQIEGLYVDSQANLGHLKWTLETFFKKLLGDSIEMRFRPSFFPFVEPGVEVDIKFKGAWMEVMGAGMVHPKVLRAGGLDPSVWTGFAFGGGIERLAMIKYKIDDIRYLFNGDLRFINQF